MRLVKLAFLSFFFIFLVVTVISLLIPSRVRISKAVNLNARPDSIFSLIKDENRWSQWHPAYMDSSGQWKTIRNRVIENTDSSYLLELQQAGRKAVTSGWVLHRYAYSDSLTLQWYMDFKLSWYPWEKFSSMFYEKTYGIMMEQGLSNLRREINEGR
jgi:hypothetical protein